MGRWLKNILGLLILVFLLWYLSKHWEELSPLLKLSKCRLGVLFGLYFVSTLINGAVVKVLVTALRSRTAFWDMVWLYNATVLLNYVPVKFGTIFRANYLKRHYGLGYTRFAVFFLYMSLLTIAVATFMGLVALVVFYGLNDYENKIMAVILATTTVGTLLLLFAPLPTPAGKWRLTKVLREFILGRSEISGARKSISITAALLIFNVFLATLITWLIYRSLNTYIHPGGCLILGALGYVVLLIGITPGGLGIRELVLSFGAAVLGIPLEIGVLAAMLDRALAFSYALVVGGVCVLLLWRKSPADFKEANKNSLTER